MSALADIQLLDPIALLRGRGIELTTIERFGIEPTELGVRYPVLNGAREAHDYREKILEPGAVERIGKYLWRHADHEGAACQAFIYAPPDLPGSQEDPLWLVEGEPDLWIAAQEGLRAVTLLHGATTAKDAAVDAIAELAGAVRIVYDNDRAGREGAERVAGKLAHRGKRATIVQPPGWLGEHGDLNDLAIHYRAARALLRPAPVDADNDEPPVLDPVDTQLDGLRLIEDEDYFCRAAASHAFAELLEAIAGVSEVWQEPRTAERPEADASTSPHASGKLVAHRAADFLALELPEPSWIVEELWREQAIGFIAGPPKSFKSFTAIDLAIACARPRAFLARYRVPQSRRVLLAQFESARVHFQRRLARGLRGAEPPAELFIVSNAELILESDESAARFAALLDEIQPAILILDPLASCTLGDENSAQDMGRIVRRLREWRDTYGCAIAVVHHVQKSADGAGRGGIRLRGSSALHAASECALWVWRADDETPRVQVRVEQKEAPPAAPFDVELEDDVLRAVRASQLTDEEIVEAVRELGRPSAEKLAAFFGKTERGIRDRLPYLVQAGRLRRIPGSGTKPATYEVPAAPRVQRAEGSKVWWSGNER